MKKTIHLISGTHWDREWRHTAEQSKLRLADLMDNIIDILENKPTYEYFCVDGGTIVLEDYFTVRPENRERVKKLIKEGKMIIVNWYTLPETNTVAPESMIRNLLTGRRMGKEFGGAMKSGYTATSYGQPSQLPQLYQGFGIENAIFYRGTNKHFLTPLFKWSAPDGSSIFTLRTFDEVTRTNWFFYVHGPAVLGKGLKDLSYKYSRDEAPVHMVDMGSYEKAFVATKENENYIHDEKVLKRSLDYLLNQAEPYAIGNNILALNMEDNDEPYRYLPELIADMNKIYPDYEIKQERMDDYMETIMNLAKSGKYDYASYEGELRNTTFAPDDFNALLGATHSSRINIKLMNEECENGLINLAEPLTSASYLLGGEYPATNIEHAWHTLLKCHAHDSICGAAVDRAHTDMNYSFSVTKTVAEEVTNRACVSLYQQIDTATGFEKEDYPIVVFNTLPFEREEVIELVIDTPKDAVKMIDNGMGAPVPAATFFDIVDEKGNIIESKELSSETALVAIEKKTDTKAIKFETIRRHILVKAKVPANGYATYALRMRLANLAFEPEIIDNRKLIGRSNGVLENEYLKVVINPNGTFDMFDKLTKRWMKNQGYYTDAGEIGSAHEHAEPKVNKTYTSFGANADIEMIEGNNELRGIYRIAFTMNIPAEASLDGHERTSEMKPLSIETYLTLEKGAKALKIKTTIINNSRDHKLTVHYPTAIEKADWCYAESAWDVAKRTIRWRDHKDNKEGFYSFQPMQNFVDVSDGKLGYAFLSKGLREYEVEDDENRTLKITLIRTQRAYMTANSKMTLAETHKYTGQHCIGSLTYEYALYPHTGLWNEGKVFEEAYANKVAMKAIMGVPTKGKLPAKASFIKIEGGDGAVVSGAFKLAENGKDIIYRIWNNSDENKKLNISTVFSLKGVKETKLDETPISDISFNDNSISYELKKHKIATFLLVK